MMYIETITCKTSEWIYQLLLSFKYGTKYSLIVVVTEKILTSVLLRKNYSLSNIRLLKHTYWTWLKGNILL